MDVTATPADDVLEWNNTTIHEGLNTGHDYNAMFLSGFRLNTTHATTNTNPY